MSSDPIIAQKSPIAVNVEAGKTYFWCACGASAKQPFCDGSHKKPEMIERGFSPVRYEATESKEVHFCACKHTGTQPFCDGTHDTL